MIGRTPHRPVIRCRPRVTEFKRQLLDLNSCLLYLVRLVATGRTNLVIERTNRVSGHHKTAPHQQPIGRTDRLDLPESGQVQRAPRVPKQ
jgi:hypothetical protein